MSATSRGNGSPSVTPPPTTTSSEEGRPAGKAAGLIKGFMFLMILILVGAGILPNLPAGSFKVIGLVIGGLIALVVLVAIMGGGSGGGEGHGAGFFVVLLALIAASALGVLFTENVKKVQATENNRQREERVILMPPPAPEPRQHFVVEAPVGQEIRIPIPMGFTCDTDPVEYGTNHVVWVRREGEDRFKDWKGRPMGSSKKSWSNYKYLESAGSVPVKVEVDIHPER